MQREKRLKKIYEKTKNSCRSGVYFDERKNRYIRFSVSDRGHTKFFRKVRSKKARKIKDVYLKGNHYRKCFDYKSTIF